MSRGGGRAAGADSARWCQPALREYSLIGDCHSAALVSSAASIDWCCLPRFDSGSCFGRLLDAERGGHCSISVDGASDLHGLGRYVEDTMVLETMFESDTATLRVLDCFVTGEHAADRAEAVSGENAKSGSGGDRREIVRVIECMRGSAQVDVELAARFDYGAVRPWLRRASGDSFEAIGGDDGLAVWSDGQIDRDGELLRCTAPLHAGERLRVLIRFVRPHLLQAETTAGLDAESVDGRLEQTIAWWRHWRERVQRDGLDQQPVVRSALTLKALTYSPTGAIVAAPTASLPEKPRGKRNWDYRFSWIRDSTLTANTLAELGCEKEAERFRHFIVRSSAGHAEDLQIMFGVGGERRVYEHQLDLGGYRGARPVRIGNEAVRQLQLDAPGEVVSLAWRWQLRGTSPDDDEWRFLSELIEMVVERWQEPDRGIWEWRKEPLQFVHSKASCWAALDRGLRLAKECMRQAPVRRWQRARNAIREAIEARGYDADRGVFVQCFDEPELDGALLLLPLTGFVEWQDERMVRTAQAIEQELGENGFVRRYRRKDGLPGREGAFLPCSFWLAECYAHQGLLERARSVFDRALGVCSPQGLFSEQVDPSSGELLGNYPQTLTHLAHIGAALALEEAARHGSAGGAGEASRFEGIDAG